MTEAIINLLKTAREITPLGYDVKAECGFAEAPKEHWGHILIRHHGFEFIAQIGLTGEVLAGPQSVKGKKIKSLMEVVTAWEGRKKK